MARDKMHIYVSIFQKMNFVWRWCVLAFEKWHCINPVPYD